ncbi:hypothetical protein [Streptomyces candidus]|uniref:Uncharacterized protein n=1 Tax=Streptomyces candidus TaxID=67283 RepID=A0A7X0HLU6_9ACTN|nr:hypothetical protein [Streptomyces candidus]MBB6439895.1 hypothetical protein [Streptomyces candidus]GHH58095.1 hypothetical protein GCM10018773_66120 [Streptomyces candidus]
MSIDRLDVPAAQVASDMAALIARQRLDDALHVVQDHDLDLVDATFLRLAAVFNWGPVSLKKQPGRVS